MDFESYARKFLAHFGLTAQCNKLLEEVLELIESIHSGDLDECVGEFSDVRNVIYQLECYVADRGNISLKMLDALIVNERMNKNQRTDKRIESNYYTCINPQQHVFIDIGDLSEADQEMIMNIIDICRRKNK